MTKPTNTNNNKNFNKPKPVTKTVAVIVSGRDQKGNEYDVTSTRELMTKLNETGVYEMLSVMTTASRSLITGDSAAKGTMKLASINSYNETDGSMELVFFGRNTEYADDVADNMAVVPRVRTDRKSGKVVKIIDFEVVNMMDA